MDRSDKRSDYIGKADKTDIINKADRINRLNKTNGQI